MPKRRDAWRRYFAVGVLPRNLDLSCLMWAGGGGYQGIAYEHILTRVQVGTPPLAKVHARIESSEGTQVSQRSLCCRGATGVQTIVHKVR